MVLKGWLKTAMVKMKEGEKAEEKKGLSTVYVIEQMVPMKAYVTAIPARVAEAAGIRRGDVLIWRVAGSRAVVSVVRPEQVPVGYLRAAEVEEGARSSVYVASRRGERSYLKTRIPAQVARQLYIRPGDMLTWSVKEGKVVLTKVPKKNNKKDGADSTTAK
jgi:bifunctional DNA-binding transcriptional regulator/antitoxin component of YhaV-PrlF toxin-antitoxin module